MIEYKYLSGVDQWHIINMERLMALDYKRLTFSNYILRIDGVEYDTPNKQLGDAIEKYKIWQKLQEKG